MSDRDVVHKRSGCRLSARRVSVASKICVLTTELPHSVAVTVKVICPLLRTSSVVTGRPRLSVAQSEMSSVAFAVVQSVIVVTYHTLDRRLFHLPSNVSGPVIGITTPAKPFSGVTVGVEPTTGVLVGVLVGAGVFVSTTVVAVDDGVGVGVRLGVGVAVGVEVGMGTLVAVTVIPIGCAMKLALVIGDTAFIDEGLNV